MLFKCDHAGYLLPPVADLSEVPEDNKMVLSQVVQLAVRSFRSNLLTVFFRGSQLFSAEHADFDMVVITRNEERFRIMEQFRKDTVPIASRSGHITEIDCMICSLEQLNQQRHLQFVVQVLSVRVFGKDLSPGLSKFKPDISSAYLHEMSADKVDAFLSARKMDLSTEESTLVCNYMIKYVIRTCFELVMMSQGIYCREIRTCEHYFSERYPGMATLSKQLISQYNNRTMDEVSFLELVTRLLSFSATQINIYQNTLAHEVENR